jgi:hypothetical protein
MAASTVYCHVLKGNVTVVTDLNGQVTNVVCPEFWRLTHGCRIKRENSSLLGILVKRAADSTIGTRGNICEFAGNEDSPAARFAKYLSEQDD